MQGLNFKKMVGVEAANYVQKDMVVGLGTGSTAQYLVAELGRRVQEEGLRFIGVATSEATKQQALALQIPMKSIDEVAYVDLTIDGADEVSADFHGIKGGGAALLFEKIVATYSRKNIWIVDESKLVDKLGAFPLPVEVIPYGSEHLLRLFTEKDCKPILRRTVTGQPLVTDSGHYIIDLHMERIDDPVALGTWLNQIVGVVEHGLFLQMASTLIIGGPQGIQTRFFS